MRRYPLETHLFPLTKSSRFGYNRYTNIVHNFWPIRQILYRASAACQELDTVLIRVERKIEITTDSNEFRSKDGTVAKIPDADFNITPGSITNYNTSCSTRIRTTTVCVNNQGLIGYVIYDQVFAIWKDSSREEVLSVRT
ncbi:hypothetical protein TNCV_4555841 [Trichonephila clavipes]|nr:hypothetical protein TNCV_4555841 [Trichonephila clavipes]